jgi:DNA-binding SARP family transcriptional activator
MGGFSLELGNGRVPLPSSASRLVAVLAIHDKTLARSLVAGLLWPDTADPAATARLRTTVWRLGKVAPGVIAATASHMGLAPGVKTDIRDVRERLISIVYGETVDSGFPEVPAKGSQIRPPPELSSWLSRELLPGWGDPWIVAERERLRQLSLHALERLAAACLDAGAGGWALTLARAATELDPLRDSAQYLLVRALLLTGDRRGAVAAYCTFRDALAREWALDPSPLLTRLALTPGVLSKQGR